MKIILIALVSAAFLHNRVVCSRIKLQPSEDDESLSASATHLLSSLENGIVYIFDWAFEFDYDTSTSTKFFTFYSQSLHCALVVETFTQFRNKSFANSRFDHPSEPQLLLTKYVRTLANIYPSAATTATVNDNDSATDHLHGVLWSYNIPFNYVLLFMSNARYSSVDNVSMFANFVGVSIPAVFILILDGHEMYLIDFAQVLQAAPFLFRINDLKETEIRKQHKEIHHDLQQSPIEISSGYPRALCNIGSSNLRFPNQCAGSTLVEYFNLTFCGASNHEEVTCSGKKICDIYLVGTLTTWGIYARRSTFNYDYINYAVYYEEFSFICIVETDMMGLMAFVKAFDRATWTITAIACTFLTVTVAVMSSRIQASWLTKLQTSAAVVLMLLIERFYGHGRVACEASRQTVVVITLWAFGALLLTMCYSGNMVSHLTSPSLPPVPKDLHQLAVVDYPVWTTFFVFEENDDKQFRKSVIHYQVNDYLEKYGRENDSLTKTLRQISKTITFANGFVPLIPASNDTISKILIALVGIQWEVQSYEIQTVMAGSKRRALFGGFRPFFSLQGPMGVQSNFLSPIFKMYLATIFESGTWKYWQDISIDQWVRDTVLLTDDPIYKIVELGQSLIRKINIATIWGNFDPLVDDTKPWSAIPFENVKPAFDLLGISLLMTLVVMLSEKCVSKINGELLLKIPSNVYTLVCGVLHNVQGWVSNTMTKHKGKT